MKTKTKPTQHTPGPWKAEGWENLVVNCAEGYTLTLAAGRKDSSLGELKANARLIAAAPDLLKKLEAMVAVFNVKQIDPLCAFIAIEQAKFAIAKATEATK